MASCPLYKSLKQRGTSFYAFPGSIEDVSAAYQNSNYRMYFSKYVLVNLPKQNLNSGTMSNPVYFDFDNSFDRSNISTPATNFNDAIIESLRNYVANHEVTLRESRLNNTKYYYDTNALETATEKIFFKWCKKLGLIDFEPAIPEDEYFSQLSEFSSLNPNDDFYFPEFLWKEREVIPFEATEFYETADPSYPNYLEVKFFGRTNFKVGDVVNFYGIVDTTILSYFDLLGYDDTDGLNLKVVKVTPADSVNGDIIIFDTTFTSNVGVGDGLLLGYAELVYNRLVQYVGEVNGVSNVQEANRSYTEVYAHIPDHTGKTPDILFRTMVDANYKPNMAFPILPSQYQPEIIGAESFNSPIVNSPQNYPGSYYGQFDTPDYTYETQNGDSVRRSGSYFGVSGDINNPVTNGSLIDGISIDFNTNHYVKMNIPGKSITNFDQFNALTTNNEPPKDFEFNAILWYYTVEDSNSSSVRTNLYGISFLDNPDNNLIESEAGLKFPSYKKLVTNGNQDGTSYAFNLNLNFNVINDNIQETYNPEAINSLFSMNLFNEAMKKLSSTNDSFLTVLVDNIQLKDEIQNIKGLIYTQTDINTINNRINNLENLLKLYSNIQIDDSASIKTNLIPGNPPRLSLTNTDPYYSNVISAFTSNMYNPQGAIPFLVSVPENKTFLLNIFNNDEVALALPNDEKLKVNISSDLDFGQVLEIMISPTQFSSQNKKMDIYMNSSYSGSNSLVLLLGNIDLPVSYNPLSNTPNSSYLWKDFKFNIDLTKDIKILANNKLSLSFDGDQNIVNNSIKKGDVYQLNNLFIGTSSVYDLSGQYSVDLIYSGTSSVQFDLSSNPDIQSFVGTSTLPMTIHSGSSTMLSNLPYFSLNKGKKIKITRISSSSILSERYKVEVNDIM